MNCESNLVVEGERPEEDQNLLVAAELFATSGKVRVFGVDLGGEDADNPLKHKVQFTFLLDFLQ